MDLTSDVHPDLVVFSNTCDATVGQTHWDVYPWRPGGFAPQPTPFAIPASICQVSFDAAASSDGNVSYATMDLTSDVHPDLVVFSNTCDATVGQTHWDVYPWRPGGFAPQPTPFAIPASICQVSFDAAASSDGNVSYATMDLTSDVHPDLVVFSNTCDATVGQTHWDVYPWRPGGFAPQPTSFAIPASICQVSFNAAASSDGNVSYATMDLTLDVHPDLVVFSSTCDATVGQNHWDVYPWSPGGFAAQPTAFAIPAPICQASFDESASSSTGVTFETSFLIDSCGPDLVVTRNACDT